MKRYILKLLRTGFVRSKRYRAVDYASWLWVLKYLVEDSDMSEDTCTCRRNPFWDPANNKNRQDLIADIAMIGRAHDIRDIGYFRVINRLANGDRYGIEVPT